MRCAEQNGRKPLTLKNSAIICLLACLAAIPLAAQQSPIAPPARWQALRQYLTLSDAQVGSLQQIQQQRQNAERAVYEQIRERQVQLNTLLRQGSNDAANIGRLMVEINNLQRQLPLPGTGYRSQALAILTEAQKTKLPALVEALRLGLAGNEAVNLNLIDRPPSQIQPRPVPLPVNEASATLVVEQE
jgi:Spy/CpxP family protein refolding chaperone